MAIGESMKKQASALGVIIPPRTAAPEQMDIEDITGKPIRVKDDGRPVERATRGPGRPATGKRSDPAFEKVGVYLDAGTRKKAERKWEDEGKGDLSDLIGQLLTAYVGDQ